jgi:hypothetical protein
LLVAFGLHAVRSDEPIIPLSLMSDRLMLLCCSLLFVAFALFVAMSVLVPLRMQLVGGALPAAAAVALLPYTLSNPLAAFIAGRWIYRSGRVVPVQRWGAILVVISMAALAMVPPSQVLGTAVALAMLGTGLGCQMPTTLMVMQNSVHPSLLGTVTSLSAFFRLLGGAIGISMLSAVVLALLRDVLPPDVAGHGMEGLGALLESGPLGAIGAHQADLAFRYTLLGAAAFSLIGVFCTQKLPDVKLGSRRENETIEVE